MSYIVCQFEPTKQMKIKNEFFEVMVLSQQGGLAIEEDYTKLLHPLIPDNLTQETAIQIYRRFPIGELLTLTLPTCYRVSSEVLLLKEDPGVGPLVGDNLRCLNFYNPEDVIVYWKIKGHEKWIFQSRSDAEIWIGNVAYRGMITRVA